MHLAFRYVATPGTCGYLPDRQWRLVYEQFDSITPAEYERRLEQGWRRFGHTLFRPRCPSCTACQSLRVLVDRFRPNRSQKRARKHNQDDVRLQIGEPAVTAEKLELYDRFHAFQTLHKGWPELPPKDAYDYAASFVLNPIPTEEWCYYVGEKLVGVGYVDRLPGSLSAVYFVHDPEDRERSLGTWNVLCVIERAAALALPYVYLGYFVSDCPSMAYKARFRPHQLLLAEKGWLEPPERRNRTTP